MFKVQSPTTVMHDYAWLHNTLSLPSLKTYSVQDVNSNSLAAKGNFSLSCYEYFRIT